MVFFHPLANVPFSFPYIVGVGVGELNYPAEYKFDLCALVIFTFLPSVTPKFNIAAPKSKSIWPDARYLNQVIGLKLSEFSSIKQN